MMANMLPFPDYSSAFWRDLDPKLIASEALVSKVHTIETLESLSPYRGNPDPYFQRVWRALNFLQKFPEVDNEMLTAAFVVFSNVIYLPQALLDDAWRGLFQDLLELEVGFKYAPLAPVLPDFNMHIFENDPTGMTTAFCQLNGLQGRLDTERYARVDSADKLADIFLDLQHPEKKERARRIIRQLYAKDLWIILVDKSLSGHSLTSDLERFLIARQIAFNAGARPPKLIILCQVMTQAAERAVKATIARHIGPQRRAYDGVSLYRAVFLDDACKLNSNECRLLKEKSLLPAIDKLCRWFADKFIRPNTVLDRMRMRSGDNLEFGYRACALTVVDYHNCPTDSLPLLWYSSEGTDPAYIGPYVRVHSRIGNQSEEPSADKWRSIQGNENILRELAALIAGH